MAQEHRIEARRLRFPLVEQNPEHLRHAVGADVRGHHQLDPLRVRLGLVLGTLGEKEGVQVNEQELQQALLARVRQFPGQERQVYEHYRKNPQALIELRGPIFEQKVVDLIVGKAKVSEKNVSREDLAAMVQDEETDGHEGHDHA